MTIFDEERPMVKSMMTYWNALNPEKSQQWKPILGLEGVAEEITLTTDIVSHYKAINNCPSGRCVSRACSTQGVSLKAALRSPGFLAAI
jgi:hypothetical protein